MNGEDGGRHSTIPQFAIVKYKILHTHNNAVAF